MMAQHLLLHPRVRITVLAERPHVLPAAPALSTGDREGDHHAVAHLDVSHFTTRLYNLAHEFVAEDVTMLHCWHEAVEQVEIRAADRSRRYLDDRVARIEYLRVGDMRHLDMFRTLPCCRLHRASSISRGADGCAGCMSDGTAVASDFNTSPTSTSCLNRRKSF